MGYLLDSHVDGSTIQLANVEDLEKSKPYGGDGSTLLASVLAWLKLFRILIGDCQKQICFSYEMIRNISPTAL